MHLKWIILCSESFRRCTKTYAFRNRLCKRISFMSHSKGQPVCDEFQDISEAYFGRSNWLWNLCAVKKICKIGNKNRWMLQTNRIIRTKGGGNAEFIDWKRFLETTKTTQVEPHIIVNVELRLLYAAQQTLLKGNLSCRLLVWDNHVGLEPNQTKHTLLFLSLFYFSIDNRRLIWKTCKSKARTTVQRGDHSTEMCMRGHRAVVSKGMCFYFFLYIC